MYDFRLILSVTGTVNLDNIKTECILKVIFNYVIFCRAADFSLFFMSDSLTGKPVGGTFTLFDLNKGNKVFFFGNYINFSKADMKILTENFITLPF